ncbi:MAG: LruC domain-containing protein [Prevotella sp.]|nr:LruC domain-containing protein [Prevotella sp.]
MKKTVCYLMAGMALVGCTNDLSDYQPKVDEAAVKENVKKVFGVDFSENQDWNTLSPGKVTITADVENFTPVKVQVLTAYPSNANDVRILNEAPIKAGQSATLVYDAPKGNDTLFAACVNAEGIYRVTSFVVGEKNVSIASEDKTRSAVTRASGTITLGTGTDSDNVTAKSKNSRWSNSTWNDMLYLVNGHRTEIADFNETQRTARRNEVYGYLPANTNNINQLSGSGYYYYANNSLTADGEEPVVLTLLGGQSAMLGWSELYYYYYTPEDVKGMTNAQETEYLKTVPKFRICDVAEVLGTGNDVNARKTDLQRIASDPTYPKYKDNIPYENWMKRKYQYTLGYFGRNDNLQSVGTTVFPEGTRIGFMMRIHEGMTNRELDGTYPIGINLYSDPRLNDEVNQYWYSISPATSHIAIFTTNGHTYFGSEDGNDRDYNDVIFEVEGGFRKYEDAPTTVDHQVYTLAFEDTSAGDYDLNDVVIKAKRVNQTTVEYSLEAAGAKDRLFLRNINGTKLNGNKEIHSILGQPEGSYINTVAGAPHVDAVKEQFTVSGDFMFSQHAKLPYLHNATKGYDIRLSERGEDPHGIVIPYDFQYPLERISVKDAYWGRFNEWGLGDIAATPWYKYPIPNKVYK